METKRENKQLSIRSIIIIVFALLLLTTVGVIGYIIFSNWVSSTDETITDMAEDMNTEIYHQIDTFIYDVMHVNEVNHRLIENDIVNLTNEIERERFFVSVLASHISDIYSFSYGSENGEYYGARRNQNGDIEIMRNNTDTGGNSWYYSVTNDLIADELVVHAGKFDPRSRDWYKAAKEMQRPVFAPIYKHFVMNDLTVSVAYPIYGKNGDLQGVLGTHIILSNIGNYLKDIVKDKNGYAVIVEKESGELIANSLDIENFTTLQDGTVKRNSITDMENEVIVKANSIYNNTGDKNFKVSTEKDSMYIKIAEYHKDGLDWLVITAIPESLLISAIGSSIQLALLLVIIATMLSIVIYYVLITKLIKPIDNLIEVTGKFSRGDLSQRADIVRNDEIGSISKAFNLMADTLHTLVNNLEATVKERTAHLKRSNDALNENKEQLQLILDSTAEAIYGIDNHGNCTFCNASCLKMLGYDKQDQLIGKDMHTQIHHSYKDGTPMSGKECKIFKAFTKGNGVYVDDEVFWRADGTCFDVEYHSYPQYKKGEVVGAVVTFMDNTNRKKADERIRYLSCHDSLTGLYNRMCFEEELKKIDIKDNLPISIIFADVNGLKLMNDIFGHAAGDKLIIKSADILKKVCREEDIVARVGGDEFVVLLPRTRAKDAEKIVERVKEELSKEQIFAVKCDMSVGYNTKTNMRQSIERTMENAEDAMYKEKTMTRKTFSSNMINAIIETLHERSPREKQHSLNVSKLCYNIGQVLELPETELKKLKEAGYFHDIGKIVIEESIINKESRLTDEEEEEMHQHSAIGYRILNLFDDTLNLAEAVYSHHERWDGSGFPKGLKGEEIPLLARIISIAESYERMINGSAIEIAMSSTEALQLIREYAGKWYDPQIAELFVRMIELDDSLEEGN